MKKPKGGDVRTESRNAENPIFVVIGNLKSQFDYRLIDTLPVGILSDVQQMWDLIEGV